VLRAAHSAPSAFIAELKRSAKTHFPPYMNIITRIVFVLCIIGLPARANQLVNPKATEVTLTKRANNNAYGTSAYSFRFASQDFASHQNFVDLVFNLCGQLHINPHGGMNSRITDLGVVDFAPVAATPSAGATWFKDSIIPQAGHVYYQEIKYENQNFAVEFIVTSVTAKTVKLRWEPVDPAHKFLQIKSGEGPAGTIGQCGGEHDQK